MRQILPPFKSVKLITNRDSYEQIYQSEQNSKTAWLLEENDSIWEFIERLAEADDKSSHETPLNFYEFYIAYNLKFSRGAVTLQNKSVKDFAELLNAVIQAGNADLVVNVNSKKLKIKILQQFIYLRIFLPITVNNQATVQAAGDIGLFGTKKAGKSALINALLGDEYAVSSPLLPTPNKITYCAENKFQRIISLTYKKSVKTFRTVDDLQKFLQEEFSRANKNSSALEDITVALPNFPAFLNGTRLIDTPGSNFAAAKGHADVTQKTLEEVAHAVFVMNYSQYLTHDEINLFDKVYKHFNKAKAQQPILIAINRVDEIFDSEESKSYVRVEDYIHYRLTALGYENFLVVGVSAIQAVYCDMVAKLLAQEPDKSIPLDEQLRKLKSKVRGTDKVAVVVFVRNILSDFEDFHGMAIDDVQALQKINRIDYLKCLIQSIIESKVTQSQPKTTPAAQSTENFNADFKRIDNMFANCATNHAIKNKLEVLIIRAEIQRDAAAMKKIADYFEKVFDSGMAYACRNKAKTFEPYSRRKL